jgi:uncharacterized protein (DUF302 family)
MSNGIITLASPHSVPDTLDRLEQILRSKNITIFSRVDHSGEAEKVGLHMPPTQLLIFGNPRGGTPLMLAEPLSAIDLPLKALAWQDPAGNVFLSYNDPHYLQQRFSLPDTLLAPIAGLDTLLQQVVT